MKVVNVAVGVIVKGNQIFVSKRAVDLHQGGLWEFPGGKIESAESVEQAMARELAEEVGIDVTNQTPFMLIEHDYGDKQVCLHVSIVDEFEGEPRGVEGQLTKWIAIQELHNLAFPAANQEIVNKLQAEYSSKQGSVARPEYWEKLLIGLLWCLRLVAHKEYFGKRLNVIGLKLDKVATDRQFAIKQSGVNPVS